MMSSAATTVWTIKELLSWTTNYLSQKGIEAARLEAQILLSHILKCPRIELIARSQEEPTAKDKASFRELVKRRVEGWPVAYLTGSKEFYLLPFNVTPAVLIPRPDTETLVLEALNKLKDIPNPKILDLCTGSGCIAIALAVNCPTAQITATDISPDAIEIAKANAAKNKVADRVTFRTGDLFNAIPAGSQFDMVVSNPPYITTSEMETLAVDIKEHEPKIALDGGPDGLAFYRRIDNEIKNWLKPNSWCILEIGDTQGQSVQALFSNRQNVSVINDMNKKQRVVLFRN
jgi:release factor glutamine methyltransferase